MKERIINKGVVDMDLTVYSNEISFDFIKINDKVTIIKNGDKTCIQISEDDSKRIIEDVIITFPSEYSDIGYLERTFTVTERYLSPKSKVGIKLSLDSSTQNRDILKSLKNSSIDLVPVELELNYNTACMNLLNTVLKGNKVPLALKVINGQLSCLHNDEIIAIDTSGKNSYIDGEISDFSYTVNSTKIDVLIPQATLDVKNVTTTDDIISKAISINYSNDKIQYLVDCGISGKLIMLLLDVVSKTKRVDVKPKTLFIDDGKKVKASLIKILNNGHIRLFGSKSTGKNTLADTLAWLLERKVYKFSSNPQADKGDLVGETALGTTIDSTGTTHVITEFQKRTLTKAMQEGAILLLDEVNANNIGLLAVLHGPCDDSRLLSTPEGDVYAENGFCVIATMNENYAGTDKLNSALVDRMLGIHFDAPNNLSKTLKVKRPNVSKGLLTYIEKVYAKILILMHDEVTDDSPFSIRGFIDVIDLVEFDFTKEEAIEMAIINRMQESEYREAVKNALEIC